MRNAELSWGSYAIAAPEGCRWSRCTGNCTADLYVRAYGRISRNHGAMTRGATHETADGMALGT